MARLIWAHPRRGAAVAAVSQLPLPLYGCKPRGCRSEHLHAQVLEYRDSGRGNSLKMFTEGEGRGELRPGGRREPDGSPPPSSEVVEAEPGGGG